MRAISDLWNVSVDRFDPKRLLDSETIFTIGNGYLGTRGAFEEGYPNDHRATFIHGVFDDAPIVFTELANAPDWLPTPFSTAADALQVPPRGIAAEHGRSHDSGERLERVAADDCRDLQSGAGAQSP